MRTVFQHIDRVRERPHHVRSRIAFGTAGVIAAAIGVVWLGTSLATGAFAIQGATFADANGAAPLKVAETGSGTGVAAVAVGTTASEPVSAPIEVIPVTPKPTTKAAPGPTVIPF